MIEIVAVRGCAGRAAVARLVARCTPESVRARLFYPSARRVGPEVVALLAGPDTGVAYLAMDGHRPVGLANMAPNPDGSVEVALLVADRWRRLGIGRALLRHAVADPRWAGLPVHATVQPANRPVLGLLSSAGLAVRLLEVSHGECYLELRPGHEAWRHGHEALRASDGAPRAVDRARAGAAADRPRMLAG